MSGSMTPETLVMEALAACARRGIAVHLDHQRASIHAAELMLRSFGLSPVDTEPAAELAATPAAPSTTTLMPRVPQAPAAALRLVPPASFLRGVAPIPS